ncbi:MAG: ABC transporter substrate-binding protein [Candidatus Woykebacteria bacterium]
MFKKIRFYLVLGSVFLNRNRKYATFSFIALLLVIFAVKILIPSLAPSVLSVYRETGKATFIEGVVGNPAHPNPLFDSTETQRDISSLIFRGLTRIGADGNLLPDLAESYEKKSETEFIFYLREDVYWHDGEKFTADDVVYTVKLAQNPDYDSILVENFRDVEIEKIDQYTVRFGLNEAFTPFPYSTAVGIIPEHIPLSGYKPIGTGDFRVVKIGDREIILTNPKMNLKFRFYPSFEEARTALKLGEIHALGGLSPQEIEMIKKFGGKNFYSHVLPFRQVVVFFNTKHRALRDKNVRQALSFAVDKKTVRELVGGATAKLASNHLALGSWVGVSKERYTYNLNKARRALEAAGYSKGEETWENKEGPLVLTIVTADDPELNSIANLLKEFWGRLGIKVSVKITEIDTLRDNTIPDRNFEVLINFQKVPLDPDQYVLWHTTQQQKANITAIASPQLDKLLEEARKSSSQEKRKEEYKLFTTLLLDEAPAIFLYYPQYIWSVSDKVSGIDLTNFAFTSDRFNSYRNWEIEHGYRFFAK